MENTAEIPSATNSNPQNNVQKEKPTKKLFLFGAAVLLLMFVLVMIFAIGSRNNSQNTTPTPTGIVTDTIPPSISITPSTNPKQISLYTISENSLQNITTLVPEKNNSLAIQEPAINPTGLVYYVDQNNVIQLSLDTQEKKVIYTNTKLASKITNVSFLQPSFLYISIIPDALDPNYNTVLDHNSNIIELNTNTNAIRTIGPLETITNGYMKYLFSSQDNDVVNIVETTYCKGEGDVFAVGSGSAKFVTKNGFGCNGKDPYLVGQIENDNKIILADPASSSNPDDFVSRYDSIYSLDIFTGKQDAFTFDLSTLYPDNKFKLVGETKFALSDDKTVVYCIIGSKVNVIDIASKKVVKTFDLSSLSIDISKYSVVAVAKSKMYLLSSATKNFAVLDLLSYTVDTTFPQNVITDPTLVSSFIYIGQWNNQPVFSTTATPSK